MAHSNRAVSTQGSKLYVQDVAPPNEPAGASLTISSITAGNPTTVTFTAAHGLEDGAIVQLGTVTGAPAFDGLTAPIVATPTTAVEMQTDTTGFAGTATGGTATALAFHELCFVDFNQTGGEANQIETTTNCSTSKEYVMGLRDSGTATVNYNADPCSDGQLELESAQADGSKRWFRFMFPVFEGDTDNVWKEFEAFVTSTSFSAAVNDKISGSANLRITGDIATVGC